MSCTCQECGNKYKLDILVADDIWRKITDKKLLCGVCIVRKIERLFGHSVFRIEEGGK